MQDYQTQKELETVERITRLFLQEYSDKWRPIYREMEDAVRFIAGDQYSDKAKAYYDSIRRPRDVFNILFPLYNNVLGDFIVSDDAMKVFAKSGGYQDISDTFQDLLDHYHILTEWRDHCVKASLGAMTKIGYMYPRWSNEIQIDGSIVTTELDQFEVGFHSVSQKPFCDDAAYMWRSRWLHSDEIIALYPHHKKKLKKFLSSKDEMLASEDFATRFGSYLNSPELVNERGGLYRVIEWHEMRHEPHVVAYNVETEEAELFTFEGKKKEQYLQSNPAVQLIDMNNQKVKYQTVLLPGFAFLLEEKKCQLQDGTYDIVPCSAYNYGRFNIGHFGIHRNAVGPQHNFNQHRNQKQHIINKTAMMSTLVKSKAFHKPAQALKYGQEPGLVLDVKDQYNLDQVVKHGEPPKWPFAHGQMEQEEAELLQRITGITPNMAGMAENANENASLFAQRIRQSRQSLNIVFHNIRRMKRRVANKELKLMQINLTQPKLFYFNNPAMVEEPRKLAVNLQIGDQILNNLQAGEYLVHADDQEQNPTARAIRFQQRTELVTMLTQMFGPQAVDVRWWLSDAEIGDVGTMIERLESLQSGMATAEEQAAAMQQMEQIQGLAAQRQQINNAELSTLDSATG